MRLPRYVSWAALTVLAVGAAALAVVRVKAARDFQDLARLFDGPATEVVPSESGFIPRPAYDMRSYAGIDALTSASLIARLACPSSYLDPRPADALTITYPPEGAAFPANLCEPEVEWEDPKNDLWQVSVGLAGKPAHYQHMVEGRRWWFPRRLWEDLHSAPSAESGQAGEKGFWVQVKGLKRPADGQNPAAVHVEASRPVHARISPYPADDYVVYRLVGVPFDTQRAPDTFIRDIRTFQESPFLLAREKYCFNCHTFSSKTGVRGKIAYQCRYLGPEPFRLRTYFAIYDLDSRRGWRAELPYPVQMTTFVAWSPDGTKLALSANQYIVAAQPITLETQLAGENTSDLAIYDVSAQRTWLLPGADRPDRLEIHPQWTADGSAIVFCLASPGHHPALVPFDLAVIPYNDGAGGEPRLIPGASANGRSNYYPRFSPDGRWLSFCQCDGGDLIRPTSDIFLLPASLEGQPHRLEANAPYAADSWHSWSSNSHWLVFATKRDDGIYARLCFTEIDAEGHASPAVRLPVREDRLESFNIPEFVAERPSVSEGQLYEAIRVEQPPVSVSQAAVPGR
jgi:hypothetical protein